MSLKPEDWKDIRRGITLFTSEYLMVDGYKITLSIEMITDVKLKYVIWINGKLEGRWLTKDCEERRRFMYRKERFLYPLKTRKEYLKIAGKKKALERGILAKYSYWNWSFPSFAALKKVLLANNESIERCNSHGGAWVDSSLVVLKEADSIDEDSTGEEDLWG